MDADSLRQITDAIYYVAHVAKIMGVAVVLAVGYMGLVILIDTTRMERHLRKLKGE